MPFSDWHACTHCQVLVTLLTAAKHAVISLTKCQLSLERAHAPSTPAFAAADKYVLCSQASEDGLHVRTANAISRKSIAHFARRVWPLIQQQHDLEHRGQLRVALQEITNQVCLNKPNNCLAGSHYCCCASVTKVFLPATAKH